MLDRGLGHSPQLEAHRTQEDAMAFTIFVDGAKLCVEFSWNLVAVTTCLHFKKTSASPTDYQELADTMAAEWAAEMQPLLTTEILMGEVVAYDLNEEFAPKYISLDEVGTPGTSSSDSVPNNTAVLVSHRTAQTGRSGRGRNYVPGLSEVAESDGLLVAATRDNLLTAWGTMITNVALTGWEFQVAQRWSDGVQLETGVMRPVVTEIILLELATQRRRQVRSAI